MSHTRRGVLKSNIHLFLFFFLSFFFFSCNRAVTKSLWPGISHPHPNPLPAYYERDSGLLLQETKEKGTKPQLGCSKAG